ncbi:MAG: glycine zipper 2TM domain-containing protein [Novosphingobium sp.]
MRNKIVTAAMALAAPALMFGAMPASAAPSFDKAPKSQVAHTESVWEHGKKHKHYHRNYSERNYYAAPRRAYYGEPVNYRTRAWRGNDGRYYCKKENGTTGLLIGGAAGALAGHQIAGSGDRTLGALLGAAGGALLGRAIDLSDSSCR